MGTSEQEAALDRVGDAPLNALSLRNVMRAAAAVGTLSAAGLHAAPPAGPAFAELGHEYPGFDQPGLFGFATGDFDRDGKDDLAFTGLASLHSAVSIHVVGRSTTGDITVKQSISLPAEGTDFVQHIFGLSDRVAGPSLSVVYFNGRIAEWTGWPLRETSSFQSLDQVSNSAVGDIDADGVPDIVMRNDTTLAAFSMATGQQKWSMPSNGSGELLLAQLDADPALELIVGGTAPGRIIDGATQAVDWSYPDAFGGHLAAGRLADPAGRSFLTGEYSITVFSGQPYSPIWDYQEPIYFAPTALAVSDVDGDDVDEILFAESPAYGLSVLDSPTHNLRHTYQFGNEGLDAIAPVDLDASGPKKIAAAGALTVSLLDLLAPNPSLWSATSRNQPFNVSTIASTGIGAVLVTAQGTVSWDAPGGLEFRDMNTGASLWQSDPMVDDDIVSTAPHRIIPIVPPTPGGEPRIVVAGTTTYDGRVLVVGAASHTVYLKIGDPFDPPFTMRSLRDVVAVDMDGDGIDDIVVASQPQFQANTGAKLHAYSQSGELIWESVAMGPPSQWINGVLVFKPELGGGDNIVAVLPEGLRAFNRVTHLLAWTMDVMNDSAFIVEHGVTGPELGIEYGNSITFYDLASRTYLRSLTLSDDIDAAKPLDGRADRLLVSSGGHLHLIDGRDGSEITSSPFLGLELGLRDQLNAERVATDTWRIGVGSDAGIFRYRLSLSDRVFEFGFETMPQ